MDAARGEEALAAAISEAETIGREFTDEHADRDLRPTLDAALSIGGDDQPLIVFSLVVDVDPDVAPGEYPSDTIDDLVTEARRMIEESEVDAWDWFVKVNLLGVAAAHD